MKNKKLVLFILIALGGLSLALFIFWHGAYQSRIALGDQPNQKLEAIYYCPMHPNFTSEKPGSCAICGMSLVKNESGLRQAQDSAAGPGVYISPQRQQLIGVKKEAVANRQLSRQIMTVGKVAYDPDLYVAQEEYIQSLKTADATKNSVLASVSAQSNSFADAARKKLLLLGMSKAEIEELAKLRQAQENLYLPDYSDTVWVYLTVYEYEIGLVKVGQEVTLDASAFPGEVFQGKVVAITPILSAETRSLRVRVEVNDSEHKLKPEMFVNAKINIDLGERLAVSETTVLDTGIRKIVYLVKDNDMLELREVNLGQKAQGYYEVLSGLKVGDIVVTSGNFLVDSESRLKSALSGQSHQHGE